MRAAQSSLKIIDNIPAGEGYFKLSLLAPAIARRSLPGQFVEVKVGAGAQPLLRRPLSIHRASKGKIELLYEVVGPATAELSRRKQGEYLDVIGPLGSGFSYTLDAIPACRQAGAIRSTLSILVAGGMGVAPLVFLAEKLRKVKSQKAKGKTLVLVGARTKKQLLCVPELNKLGCEVRIATDDGSAGFRGKATDLLGSILRSRNHDPGTTIYSCGPHPMLAEVSRLSRRYNLPAQLSLEAHMACGFGACLGCVVETIGGYKRVCKDGPVFGTEELVFAKEAKG
jgi:dihydroorotate dehydrogenase electron transfer subunit